MKVPAKNQIIFVSAFLGALGAFAFASHRSPPADYDRLYPESAELCAVTQITRAGGSKGGAGGHAVLYLHGACRDRSAEYPRIKICDGGGVGISVDQEFENANWVAVEDRGLFFGAGVPEWKVLDVAAQERQIAAARADRIFKGVTIHSQYLHPEDSGKQTEDIFARHGFGTDYNLSAGRNVYCARIPLTREGMSSAVDYLNGLNDQFRSGSVYEWNVLGNNCAHVAHNALAAAGIWSPKQVSQPIPVQLFNLSIPADEFVELSYLANDQPLEDVRAIYRNPVLRESLLLKGSLPLRDGVISEVIPLHKPNELFDLQSNFLLLDNFITQRLRKHFVRASTNEDYLDLELNIARFIDRAEKAIAVLENGDSAYEAPLPGENEAGPAADPEYERFRTSYIDYLKKEKSAAEKRYLMLQHSE